MASFIVYFLGKINYYRRKEKEENKNNDIIAYIKSYLNKSEYLYWTK